MSAFFVSTRFNVWTINPANQQFVKLVISLHTQGLDTKDFPSTYRWLRKVTVRPGTVKGKQALWANCYVLTIVDRGLKR